MATKKVKAQPVAKSTAVATLPEPAPVVLAYKGMDKDMQCRGHQFEVGKTYEHIGSVEMCKSGWHACENPLDVLTYYQPTTSRFFGVTMSGDIKRKREGDSKVASASITISAQLTLPELIASAVTFIAALAKGNTATGNYGNAAATGYSGHAAATGNYGNAAATGDSGHAAAMGDYGNAAAMGYSGVAAALNLHGKAKASATGAIVLVAYNEDRSIRHIRASKVGDNGIKPDVWYSLNDTGEFVETEIT